MVPNKYKLLLFEYNKAPSRCKTCHIGLSFRKRKQHFCSRECFYIDSPLKSNTYIICIFCQKKKQVTRSVSKRHKYCSNVCQNRYQSQRHLEKWLNNIIVKKVCGHWMRRYIIERDKNKCAICGWDEIHPTLKYVPLEVDHKDGNHLNNIPENLRALCPNCHALQPNHKALNKGKGRTLNPK